MEEEAGHEFLQMETERLVMMKLVERIRLIQIVNLAKKMKQPEREG